MYKGIYIPSAMVTLFVGGAMAVLYLGLSFIVQESKTRNMRITFLFSLSLYAVLALGSIVYHSWKLEAFISSLGMLKIALVILTLAVIYINIVYVRAEISYKRKRGNQRIQEEPKKTLLERKREEKERRERGDIVIMLGHSKEVEDKSPPV